MERTLEINKKTVNQAARIMIERYRGRAVIEVNARIDELNIHQLVPAKELWIEIRKEIERINTLENIDTLH